MKSGVFLDVALGYLVDFIRMFQKNMLCSSSGTSLSEVGESILL
jgi:hypothetical protein